MSDQENYDRRESNPLEAGSAEETAPVAQGTESVAEFRKLDPRVVPLWRTSGLIGWGIFLVILLVVGMVIDFGVPGSRPYVLGVWLGLALLAAFLILWHPPRSYRAWSYRFDEYVLELRFGIVVHVVQVLPLNRLQHVDLHRGPLERYFGLASVVLFTAGTQNVSMVIPGLDADEAARFRDELVARGGAYER